MNIENKSKPNSLEEVTSMRKLTNEEFAKTREIIENTEWVKNQVNYELNAGKGWDVVMYQVAEAFGIVK